MQKLGANVRVIVRCVSEPCRATVAGTVRVPRIGRTPARTLRLAQSVKAIARGRQATLTPRLSATTRAAIRRALLRRARITVSLTASVADAARNTRKLRRNVRLTL